MAQPVPWSEILEGHEVVFAQSRFETGSRSPSGAGGRVGFTFLGFAFSAEPPLCLH